ncbi:MAG: tetratricopeptide repeat protein, partial [Bacteroidales bacterium]|nr:tetratricopeptide repeat protein [Bacteroidales bacterium]
MKQLLTILLLLPLCVFAQSRESKQLYKQGMKLFDAEKYEEALPYFQKSDSLDKAQHNPTHKNYHRAELMVAKCYYKLADQANKEGRYNDAVKFQTNVVEIRKKVLGEEHPDYAMALSNLAYYYDELGNYTEAIRLATVAMEIYKKTLGEEHPDYANSLHNLASYCDELGNYTEAIRLGTLAVEICKKVLGEEHPNYAISLNNLAIYNDKLGNYTEAINLETRALEIRKKALGDAHPDNAISLNRLADYYLITGNYDAATDYYSQCYNCLNSFILKTFASMTTKERNDFWKSNSTLFTNDLPYAAYKMASDTVVETSYYGVSTNGVATKNTINAL